MLEPVIKTVAARLMKDPEQVFSQVKENVIKLFLKDLESQDFASCPPSRTEKAGNGSEPEDEYGG